MTVTSEMIEAACQARCMIPGVHWADGITEGMARIERMLAEKMLEAAFANLPHPREPS